MMTQKLSIVKYDNLSIRNMAHTLGLSNCILGMINPDNIKSEELRSIWIEAKRNLEKIEELIKE